VVENTYGAEGIERHRRFAQVEGLIWTDGAGVDCGYHVGCVDDGEHRFGFERFWKNEG
jgi:hypothetical protein